MSIPPMVGETLGFTYERPIRSLLRVFRKRTRMTTVVEQSKRLGDREQARRSKPILNRVRRSHAAKHWWPKATDVAWLRGFSESRPGLV